MSAEGGSLEVLNAGEGHLRLTFKKKDSVECHRARRMVEDMLRRGYAIFAQVGKELVPIRRFDAAKAEYLITDVPPGAEERFERGAEPTPSKPDSCPRCQQPRHRGRCRQKPLPMEKTKAVAVGRSAGG